MVEFANRDGVASLLGEAAVPSSSSHEAAVPFKSRLLSLKHRGAADSPLQPSEPQSTIPISQLIRRLSEKETVRVRFEGEAHLPRGRLVNGWASLLCASPSRLSSRWSP